MSEFKKVKIYLEPVLKQEYVVKENDIFINDTRQYSWGCLSALKCERITCNGHAWNGTGIQTNIKFLYFTNDEDIKNGDYFINDDGVWQCNNNIIPTGLNPKKIVATNNKSLINLPFIPDSFVKEYCNNNGNIDEVEIEYIEDFVIGYANDRMRKFYGKPIINIDSNNCVIIRSIKNNWNREELETMIENYRLFAWKNSLTIKDKENWIKDNL